MEIFGISGNELLVIMLLAALVLGPQRLAVVAREVGKLIRNVKAYMASLTDELRTELDVLDEIKEINKDLNRRV